MTRVKFYSKNVKGELVECEQNPEKVVQVDIDGLVLNRIDISKIVTDRVLSSNIILEYDSAGLNPDSAKKFIALYDAANNKDVTENHTQAAKLNELQNLFEAFKYKVETGYDKAKNYLMYSLTSWIAEGEDDGNFNFELKSEQAAYICKYKDAYDFFLLTTEKELGKLNTFTKNISRAEQQVQNVNL